MSIGARIREAREQVGFSQAQLARALGITRSACSQWEASDGTAPRRERLEQIARLLGVSYEWLATGRSTVEPGVLESSPGYASSLTAEQREMLELYQRMSPASRRTLLDFLRTLQATRPATPGWAESEGPG